MRYGRLITLRALEPGKTTFDLTKVACHVLAAAENAIIADLDLQNRIQYLPLDDLGARRRKFLEQRYYFDCDCRRCKETTEDQNMLAIKCAHCANGVVPPAKDRQGLRILHYTLQASLGDLASMMNV